MRRIRLLAGVIAAALKVVVGVSGGALAAQPCSGDPAALGVARAVEIDASTGPLFGDISKYMREPTFLQPKEVVLTFDDGPLPWITKSILDTLDRYCTKATFFSVGQMAMAYPGYAKEVIARGHTLGTHTWSHPMNLKHLNFEKAKDQIERGFAAVTLAAGQPIAPFFRFPGLNDSDPLLAYLQTRGVAAFTVDVVSNDSYIASPARLTERTLRAVDAKGGGILLFHDIKASTAKALPDILAGLKQRGYSVVHMLAKTPAVPLAEIEKQLAPALAKTLAAQRNNPDGTKSAHQLQPFFGATAMLKPDPSAQAVGVTPAPAPASGPAPAVATAAAASDLPVSEVTSPLRTRVATVSAAAPDEKRGIRKSRRTASAQNVASIAVDTDSDTGSAKPATSSRVKFKPAKKPAPATSATFSFPF